MMSRPTWQALCNEWLDDGGEFPAAEIAEAAITTIADAALVVSLLERQAQWLKDQLIEFGDVRALLVAFERIETTQAFMYLARHAMPHLLDIFEKISEKIPSDDDLLGYLLMLFSRFGTSEGWNAIVAASGDARLCNLWVWDGFIQWPREQDPIIPKLVKLLSPKSTEDTAAVASLFWLNQLARADQILTHPYDSPEGIQRLSEWLDAAAPLESRSVAGKAAASAIPFISASYRPALFELADQHPEMEVQLESAWAHAYLKEESGFTKLVSACEDDELAANAAAYLDDLNAGHLVPQELRRRLSDFQE